MFLLVELSDPSQQELFYFGIYKQWEFWFLKNVFSPSEGLMFRGKILAVWDPIDLFACGGNVLTDFQSPGLAINHKCEYRSTKATRIKH